MSEALPVLQKASGKVGFLQGKEEQFLSLVSTEQVKRLKQVILNSNSVSEDDRMFVASFLENGEEGPDDLSTVKQLIEQTLQGEKEDKDEATKQDKKDQTIFEELLASRNKEISTIKETVAQKIDRQGALRVHLVEVKGQLSDAQKSTGDVKLLEKVAEQCKAKSADWEIREKTRAEELLAIADTIKILNDDAAADLLKSTVNNPPSFLQLDSKQMRQDAVQLVKDLSTEAAQKAFENK